MSRSASRPGHATAVNLWLDLALFAAMLLALAPAFTGLAIHEWLSLALAVTVIAHLLRHWSWLSAIGRRFLGRLPGPARLNALLNLAFFIDLTLIMFTGVVISREALPWLGLPTSPSPLWSSLHRLTADLSVFIVGLHLAVHWKWLVSAGRRYLINPLFTLGRRPAAPAPEAQP